MTLEELLEREGLGDDVDALVAWAHRRAEALASGLENDPELGPLLVGGTPGASNGTPHHATAEVAERPEPRAVEPVGSVEPAMAASAREPDAVDPVSDPGLDVAADLGPSASLEAAPAGEPPPPATAERPRAQPLPPLPTAEPRIEVISASDDDVEEIDELELLDEDDLELVEDDDDDALDGGAEPLAAAPSERSPEWKQALESAQTGDDSSL